MPYLTSVTFSGKEEKIDPKIPRSIQGCHPGLEIRTVTLEDRDCLIFDKKFKDKEPVDALNRAIRYANKLSNSVGVTLGEFVEATLVKWD